MKEELIHQLRSYKAKLNQLKKDVQGLPTERVSRKKVRTQAEQLASLWVEELRSPLEHKIGIEKATIEVTSERIKRLYVLSRPNNLKSSYTKCINAILKDFENKFVLPIQQAVEEEAHPYPELHRILDALSNLDETEYLAEAIACAEHGFLKAAIVMGWCAAIDRIQRKLLLLGLAKFNAASSKIKAQTSGKFKRWNKEFNVTNLSELQTVFDTDLIVILEGMNLIDGNQAQRLETNFQYRNHSAHPGEAPVEPAHAVSFFTDLNSIIFNNPKLSLNDAGT